MVGAVAGFRRKAGRNPARQPSPAGALPQEEWALACRGPPYPSSRSCKRRGSSAAYDARCTAGPFRRSSDLNDDHLEPRLTRSTALRLAAAGAAGLAVGTRPARAAPTTGAPVEEAARAFLASLSPAERARASFPFASAERTRWHWTIPSSVPRNGLPLGAISPAQRQLALALLRTSTSPAGYRKALDIMALQGVLRRMNTGFADPFDPDLYFVSVFGTPGTRVGVAARGTPSFEALHRGRRHHGRRAVLPRCLADPCRERVPDGRAGYRTMPREEDAAREIVLLLDGRLRRQVVFSSESLTDHVTQNAVR